MKHSANIAVISLLLMLTACGDGRETSHTPTDPRPKPAPGSDQPTGYTPCDASYDAGSGLTGYAASPGGIWRGTMTNEVLRATSHYWAYVSEDGRFWSQASQFGVLAGALTVEDTAFSGAGFADSRGRLWHDGSFRSELSVSGTVAERDKLEGTFGMASGDMGCFTLSYDRDRYELQVTIADFEGAWSTTDGWGFIWPMDIRADGTFTQATPYDCETTMSGKLAAIDGRFNLFTLHRDAPGCDPEAGAASGFAFVFPIPAVGPKQADGLVFAMYDARYAWSHSYTRPVVASD